MKIQCDVCHKAEACVFCVADEAALCQSCDRRIHHPNNNLVNDHHTLSLLQPSPKHSPLCDICQASMLKSFLIPLMASASDDLESNLSTFSSEITPATTAYGGQIGIKNSMEAANKSSRKWRDNNNSFAVPQISTSPFTFKKSRTLC
nr:B-box zinc finger protein 21-like [Ipomoea batatas]